MYTNFKTWVKINVITIIVPNKYIFKNFHQPIKYCKIKKI